MACTFPYIEKNFRKSNPYVADKLNQIGLDTWTEIKDSNLFTKKEGSYVFNKQGTIRREKQNQLVNSINDKLGGNVVTEVDKKVAVNLVPIFNRFQPVEPTPQLETAPIVLETPTISEEPVFPKVDTLKLEWDEYENLLKNPDNITPSSLYLISKFKGYDSLEQYKEVATGANPQAFSEYADQKLFELLKDFTDTIGVGIKDIEEFQQNYLERTGKLISASGVADLINKTIYVSEGNLDALTEEVAHFIVAMLPKDNPIYQAIDAYLENTPEFVIYYDVYLDKYQGNGRKTRDEIMGKIIKNVFQNKKEKPPLSLKTLINYVLDYIRSIFSDKALQYKQATASIKQMFFAQSLVESLSDLDTANGEMYQLSYKLLGDLPVTKTQGSAENVVEVNIDSFFDNIVPQLENYIEKAKQSGNSRGLQTANSILNKIKNNDFEQKSKDVVFVEIFNTISKSLNGVRQAFGQLSAKDFDSIKTLFAEGGQYSPTEMAKLQNEEYSKRLKQIGAYINYIQNLKDFAATLQSIRQTAAGLQDENYKAIIELLNPTLAENKAFIQAVDFVSLSKIDSQIDAINSAYNNASKIIVEGLLNATTTADQREFIEKFNIKLIPNSAEQDLNKQRDKDTLTWLRTILMPTSMQNDIFLQTVNSFVSFMQKKAKDEANKIEAEVLKLQEEIGFGNQEFVSSRDKKGNLTFKLLTKYNYSVYATQKTDYVLNTVIPNLIKNGVISNEAIDFLKALRSVEFSSTDELYEAVANAFSDKVIEYNDFAYIDKYTKAAETLYNVKRFVPSQGLSDVASEGVKNYIETVKKVYTEAFANPNFDWSSDSVQLALDSEIDTYELYTAIMEKIEEKRKLLEKKYYTFDPDTTNMETNLVFKNQYNQVQGLLNYYETTLGYTETEDGVMIPSLIKTNKFGEEYLFELSGEEVDGIPADYVDKDYKKLEEEANDVNNKNNKQAIAKLKLIDKIKTFNKENNKPTNFLGNHLKSDSEFTTFKFFGERYRLPDFITKIGFPAAFAAYITPAIMTGDWSLMSRVDAFSELSLVGQVAAFTISIGTAKQFLEILSGLTENFSREINSITDIKGLARAVAKTFNMPFRLLNLEMEREEDNKTPIVDKPSYVKRMFGLIGRMYRAVTNWASGKKSVVNVPTSYQPLNLIPQWQTTELPAYVRSTQFIDNFKKDVVATYDYNTKVSFEGVIKYMDVVQKTRTDIPAKLNDYIENTYLNINWYKLVAPKNALRKAIFFTKRLTSRYYLSGNILADVKNFLQAQIPFIINSGPVSTGKSAYKSLIYSLGSLVDVVKNDKKAIESNFIQQVKKKLQVLQMEADTGQSVLARKMRLSNLRQLNALGESFIASQAVYLTLADNKLVDEKGNTYDIVKHFELRDGEFKLKKGAPQPYFSFITQGQSQQLSTEDLSKINPAGKVNVSNISDEGKKLLTPSTLDIENYINKSLIKNMEYFHEKTQIYSRENRPLFATTQMGMLVYQFSTHLPSMFKNALGLRRRNINTGELEEGFLLGTLSVLVDMLKAGVNNINKNKAIQDFFEENPGYDNKNNEKQKVTITDYLSVKNQSVVFAAELFTLSDLLSAEYTTNEIREIAKQIYNGDLKYNGLEGGQTSEENIFRVLYSSYLQNREINKLRATSLRKTAVATLLGVGMFKLATFLLAKAMKGAGDDDDITVWLKFIAMLTQSLLQEAVYNYTTIAIVQKFGINLKQFLNQKIFGWGSQGGDLGILDPFGSIVSGNFIQDRIRDVMWGLSVAIYNNVSKDGLLFYDDKQFKALKKVTKGKDLPYFRTQYKIKTTPSGKKGVPGKPKLKGKPINIPKQELLDVTFTPKFRDIYKQNPLKKELYKKIPKDGRKEFMYKIDKGYLRQTGGRELLEDIKPSKDILEEMNKKKNPENE